MTKIESGITILEADSTMGAELESRLLSTLAETVPQSLNSQLVLSATVPAPGKRQELMVGGLTAGTS